MWWGWPLARPACMRDEQAVVVVLVPDSGGGVVGCRVRVRRGRERPATGSRCAGSRGRIRRCRRNARPCGGSHQMAAERGPGEGGPYAGGRWPVLRPCRSRQRRLAWSDCWPPRAAGRRESAERPRLEIMPSLSGDRLVSRPSFRPRRLAVVQSEARVSGPHDEPIRVEPRRTQVGCTTHSGRDMIPTLWS